ncbi:MAG: hypothetical protein ACC656_07705, partial [Candidatus Heimdallarchaeota archaeon]
MIILFYLLISLTVSIDAITQNREKDSISTHSVTEYTLTVEAYSPTNIITTTNEIAIKGRVRESDANLASGGQICSFKIDGSLIYVDYASGQTSDYYDPSGSTSI